MPCCVIKAWPENITLEIDTPTGKTSNLVQALKSKKRDIHELGSSET